MLSVEEEEPRLGESPLELLQDQVPALLQSLMTFSATGERLLETTRAAMKNIEQLSQDCFEEDYRRDSHGAALHMVRSSSFSIGEGKITPTAERPMASSSLTRMKASGPPSNSNAYIGTTLGRSASATELPAPSQYPLLPSYKEGVSHYKNNHHYNHFNDSDIHNPNNYHHPVTHNHNNNNHNNNSSNHHNRYNRNRWDTQSRRCSAPMTSSTSNNSFLSSVSPSLPLRDHHHPSALEDHHGGVFPSLFLTGPPPVPFPLSLTGPLPPVAESALGVLPFDLNPFLPKTLSLQYERMRRMWRRPEEFTDLCKVDLIMPLGTVSGLLRELQDKGSNNSNNNNNNNANYHTWKEPNNSSMSLLGSCNRQNYQCSVSIRRTIESVLSNLESLLLAFFIEYTFPWSTHVALNQSAPSSSPTLPPSLAIRPQSQLSSSTSGRKTGACTGVLDVDHPLAFMATATTPVAMTATEQSSGRHRYRRDSAGTGPSSNASSSSSHDPPYYNSKSSSSSNSSMAGSNPKSSSSQEYGYGLLVRPTLETMQQLPQLLEEFAESTITVVEGLHALIAPLRRLAAKASRPSMVSSASSSSAAVASQRHYPARLPSAPPQQQQQHRFSSSTISVPPPAPPAAATRSGMTRCPGGASSLTNTSSTSGASLPSGSNAKMGPYHSVAGNYTGHDGDWHPMADSLVREREEKGHGDAPDGRHLESNEETGQGFAALLSRPWSGVGKSPSLSSSGGSAGGGGGVHSWQRAATHQTLGVTSSGSAVAGGGGRLVITPTGRYSATQDAGSSRMQTPIASNSSTSSLGNNQTTNNNINNHNLYSMHQYSNHPTNGESVTPTLTTTPTTATASMATSVSGGKVVVGGGGVVGGPVGTPAERAKLVGFPMEAADQRDPFQSFETRLERLRQRTDTFREGALSVLKTRLGEEVFAPLQHYRRKQKQQHSKLHKLKKWAEKIAWGVKKKKNKKPATEKHRQHHPYPNPSLYPPHDYQYSQSQLRIDDDKEQEGWRHLSSSAPLSMRTSTLLARSPDGNACSSVVPSATRPPALSPSCDSAGVMQKTYETMILAAERAKDPHDEDRPQYPPPPPLTEQQQQESVVRPKGDASRATRAAGSPAPPPPLVHHPLPRPGSAALLSSSYPCGNNAMGVNYRSADLYQLVEPAPAPTPTPTTTTFSQPDSEPEWGVEMGGLGGSGSDKAAGLLMGTMEPASQQGQSSSSSPMLCSDPFSLPPPPPCTLRLDPSAFTRPHPHHHHPHLHHAFSTPPPGPAEPTFIPSSPHTPVRVIDHPTSSRYVTPTVSVPPLYTPDHDHASSDVNHHLPPPPPQPQQPPHPRPAVGRRSSSSAELTSTGELPSHRSTRSSQGGSSSTQQQRRRGRRRRADQVLVTPETDLVDPHQSGHHHHHQHHPSSVPHDGDAVGNHPSSHTSSHVGTHHHHDHHHYRKEKSHHLPGVIAHGDGGVASQEAEASLSAPVVFTDTLTPQLLSPRSPVGVAYHTGRRHGSHSVNNSSNSSRCQSTADFAVASQVVFSPSLPGAGSETPSSSTAAAALVLVVKDSGDVCKGGGEQEFRRSRVLDGDTSDPLGQSRPSGGISLSSSNNNNNNNNNTGAVGLGYHTSSLPSSSSGASPVPPPITNPTSRPTSARARRSTIAAPQQPLLVSVGGGGGPAATSSSSPSSSSSSSSSAPQLVSSFAPSPPPAPLLPPVDNVMSKKKRHHHVHTTPTTSKSVPCTPPPSTSTHDVVHSPHNSSSTTRRTPRRQRQASASSESGGGGGGASITANCPTVYSFSSFHSVEAVKPMPETVARHSRTEATPKISAHARGGAMPSRADNAGDVYRATVAFESILCDCLEQFRVALLEEYARASKGVPTSMSK